MRQKIIINSIQYPLLPFNSLEEWSSAIEKWIESSISQKAQIILFPEYGSMDLVSLFEPSIQKSITDQLIAMQGLLSFFQSHFSSMASKYDVTIIAPSFPVLQDTHYVNRVYVFSPSGKSAFQDKWWLTRTEKEEWCFIEGDKKLILFDTGFCQFGIQNCYDIEFPVGAYHLTEVGAQIIMVPSCTKTIQGASRVHIGARARAMEYQCYTVVSQIVGNAQWSMVNPCYGYSAFYSTPDIGFPKEGIIAKGLPQVACGTIAELDLDTLTKIRSHGQVLNYKDHKQLNISMKDVNIRIEKIDLT